MESFWLAGNPQKWLVPWHPFKSSSKTKCWKILTYIKMHFLNKLFM